MLSQAVKLLVLCVSEIIALRQSGLSGSFNHIPADLNAIPTQRALSRQFSFKLLYTYEGIKLAILISGMHARPNDNIRS